MPSIDIIRNTYKNAEIIESVRGNKFRMEDYNINSIHRQRKEIFITSKDGWSSRCLYDDDTEIKATIIK